MKYQPQFGYDCADFEEVDSKKYWMPILILVALIILYFTLKNI